MPLSSLINRLVQITGDRMGDRTIADSFHYGVYSLYEGWTNEVEAHDAWLLQHIYNSVRPLQLTIYDLQSIHRRFELYTENFPPDTNGLVDAETWQTYCDLQFSQFPLYFVEDENETAVS